jgi:diguanylate cyclase (GGDEF)-like protein/PAS domain S-box-containing protein
MAAENIIATMNEMFFLLSPEGSIVRTNKASQHMLGYEEKELVGNPLSKVCGDEPESRKIIQQVRKQDSVQNIETVCRTKTGGAIPVIFSGSALKDRHGQILGIIGVIRDISDRKRMEEELRALSLQDELTGLYNRRGFLILAQHKQLISNREGKEMLLIYADVDDLKHINDTYGHAEGDAALVATARILKETFRSSDIIARLGGDEFVVLAAEASGACSGPVKARLEEKVKASTAKEAFPFALSLSLGIVCCDPRSACSLEGLLARADQAMYAHKHK